MLILTVGISGSGKTTWTKLYCKGNPEIIRLSSDELRAIYGSGEEDQTVSGQVFRTLEAMTEYFLKENKSVLIDATNLTMKSRKPFYKLADKYNHKKFAYIFPIELNDALDRNQLRERQVPNDVIVRQYENRQHPSIALGEVDNLVIINSASLNAVEIHKTE